MGTYWGKIAPYWEKIKTSYATIKHILSFRVANCPEASGTARGRSWAGRVYNLISSPIFCGVYLIVRILALIRDFPFIRLLFGL